MSTTAEYYERYWADPKAAPPSADPTTETRRRMLRASLRDLPRGARVLDAGCGAGEFTEFLRELCYEALGTDLSELAIAFAKKRFPDAKFRKCTPEQLVDEMSGQFHAVWSSEVIEHVFDVYAFLGAFNRLLTPGGKLILTTPYHGVPKSMLIAAFAHETHFNPFGGHIRFFNKRGLARCLKHCGFTATQWSGFGRPWPLYKSFFVVAEKTHESLPPPLADS